MLRSFSHKGLERFWRSGNTSGIVPHLSANIRRKLDAMSAAQSVGDLNVPGFNLHPLKGNRAGEWAIKVTGNYRLTFRWEEPKQTKKTGAVEVNLEELEENGAGDTEDNSLSDDDEPGPAGIDLVDYH